MVHASLSLQQHHATSTLDYQNDKIGGPFCVESYATRFFAMVAQREMRSYDVDRPSQFTLLSSGAITIHLIVLLQSLLSVERVFVPLILQPWSRKCSN